MTDQRMPEPWATWAERRGSKPTYSDLAPRVGVAVETLRRAVRGMGQPNEQTLRAIADYLGVDIVKLRKQVGLAGKERTPFTLPAEADRLSRRQREAVLAVVRAMLDPEEVPDDPAPMTPSRRKTGYDLAARKREPGD